MFYGTLKFLRSLGILLIGLYQDPFLFSGRLLPLYLKTRQGGAMHLGWLLWAIQWLLCTNLFPSLNVGNREIKFLYILQKSKG